MGAFAAKGAHGWSLSLFVPRCSSLFLCVHLCSSVFLCVPLCSSVFLFVHLCSSVFLGVPLCSSVLLCVCVWCPPLGLQSQMRQSPLQRRCVCGHGVWLLRRQLCLRIYNFLGEETVFCWRTKFGSKRQTLAGDPVHPAPRGPALTAALPRRRPTSVHFGATETLAPNVIQTGHRRDACAQRHSNCKSRAAKCA